MYIRGAAAGLCTPGPPAGLPGWGYADVLPYFKRSEHNWRGETVEHGGAGPMHVSPMKPDPILFPTFAETAEGARLRDRARLQRRRARGLPGFPIARSGTARRHSTAGAFLDPATGRSNLRVETNALVTRIVVEDGRATGVEFRRGGETHVIRARREVILSAGAINARRSSCSPASAPQFTSGRWVSSRCSTGPASARTCRTHPIALSFWNASKPVTFDSKIRLDKLIASFVQWQLHRNRHDEPEPHVDPGLPALVGGSGPAGLAVPDRPLELCGAALVSRLAQACGPPVLLGVLLLDPESRGRVRLASSNPAALPKVHLNFLSEEGDVTRLREAVALHAPLHDRQPGQHAGRLRDRAGRWHRGRRRGDRRLESRHGDERRRMPPAPAQWARTTRLWSMRN